MAITLHKDLTGADLHVPGAHKTQHENGGSDEISVAGLSGLLADGQTPITHATSHQSGGGDAIKLDDLATPDDNTDLDASTSRHGLLKKLPGGTTDFLRADGTFAAPTGAGIQATIVDAKGDLIAATAADTVARLAVGTNGHVLTADSGEATGLKWAAAAGGGTAGYVMREEHVASASSSLDFTSWYSSSYETYVIEIIDIVTSGNTELGVQVSVDGGSTWLASTTYEFYSSYVFSGGSGNLGSAGTTRFSLRQGSATTLAANCGYVASIKLQNPGSAKHKMFYGDSPIEDNSAGMIFIRHGGRIKTTSAINGIRIIADSGTLTSGTVRIHGIAKA